MKQYRLVWMLDGEEQFDHRLWPNKLVPQMVRDYLQETFLAMEIRIEEIEDDAPPEGTGTTTEGGDGGLQLERQSASKDV
jgi:hypothetical protein